MSKKKAFTIIELLVVITVIAILVGIAIPRFKGIQDEANQSRAKAELRVLQTAIESFYMNSTPNAYPGTTQQICQDDLNGATPLIVAEILYDPFRSSAEYRYRRSSNADYYVVYSYGPNGDQDIDGIGDDGVLSGTDDDDIFATNGTGAF